MANILMTYNIDLASLVPRGQIAAVLIDHAAAVQSEQIQAVSGGTVLAEPDENALFVRTFHALPYNICKPGIRNSHYMELPGRYELPMRVDITAKIDTPALYIEVGNGFAAFGSHGSDIRRYEDICEPKHKVNRFNNRLIMNEYNDISLIFGFKEMQFLVNGEERYYSKHEPYFKSRRLARMNEEGFQIRVTCEKNANLYIKSIQITEYIGIAEILRPLMIETGMTSMKRSAPVKRENLEDCINELPDDLRHIILRLDEWLLNLRPLEFSRRIGNNGDIITYLAPEHGFSYALYPSDNVIYHKIEFVNTAGRRESDKKTDRMEEILGSVSGDLASRLFANLHECINGRGTSCAEKAAYSYGGQKKVVCHGMMRFNMTARDFDDAKSFIDAFNRLLPGAGDSGRRMNTDA